MNDWHRDATGFKDDDDDHDDNDSIKKSPKGQDSGKASSVVLSEQTALYCQVQLTRSNSRSGRHRKPHSNDRGYVHLHYNAK